MKRTAPPAKIWSTLWAQPSEQAGAECDCDCADCVCDACSDTCAQAQPSQRTGEIAGKIARGEIQAAAFGGDGYFAADCGHWVAVPAASSHVVVMEEHWGAFLEGLRGKGPAPLADYRAALGGTEAQFAQAMAVLIDHGILAAPGQALLQPVPGCPRTLSAWMHLTDQCNLRCGYCYVSQGKQRMTEETARAAAAAVFQSAQAHGFASVKLKYAGGEPTLNFAALMAAQQEAEICAAQTGSRLDSVMLTNGYRLIGEHVAYLLAHNIRVMLSLDGPRAVHDQNRPAAQPGASSHDRAVSSIDRLIAAGIMPHISITLTRLNLYSVAELVRDEILGRGLSFSLNFYRPSDNAGGGGDPLLCPPEELARGMLQVYAAIKERLPRRRIFDNLVDRAHPGRDYPFACGAGRQYLVIDCAGNIAPCQMELHQPVAHIADADPLTAIRAWGAGVLGGTASDCAGCAWRYRCAAGCPRLIPAEAEQGARRSPLCAVYRQLLPAAIHLEAERLLRYEHPIPFL